ncbi:MAG: hypothetical protein KF723_22415 [Rhizobiaceae bacterium]|nr:hypothetical protein [Rhizobiaceae bacterium]
MGRRQRPVPALTEPAPIPTAFVTGFAVGHVDSMLHILGWAHLRLGAGADEHRVQIRIATTAAAAHDLCAQISREK